MAGISRLRALSLPLALLVGTSSAAFGYAVYGAIADKYAALGGQGGFLGAPLSDEADALHGGRFNRFQGGFIHWHPRTAAFATGGDIDRKWNELGRAAYGYPITDELSAGDNRGRYNHFRAVHLAGMPEGSIYWTPQTGAHVIYGAIRAKWMALGAGLGALGYPTGDEVQDGGFRRTTFERGFIRWTSAGGAEPIMTRVEGPRAGGFAGLVVNGVKVATDLSGGPGPATVFLDRTVLSPPELCARVLNQPGLNDTLRNTLVTRIRAELRGGFGIHSQTNHTLGNTCSARAELTSPRVGIVVRVPANRFFVRITTPTKLSGDLDPNFVITYDLVLSTTLTFPASPAGNVVQGPVTVTAANVSRPTSNSVTGNYLSNFVGALLAGPGFSGPMQQGGAQLSGVNAGVNAINAALAQVRALSPPGARFDSYPQNDLAVLEATTRPRRPGPG